ncbi:MAG: dihydroorotase family protein [Planctomycetota bacterium]
MSQQGSTGNQESTSSTWLLEGELVESTGREKSRLRICKETGLILERGDLRGDPDVTWPEGVIVCPGFIDIHVHCRDDPEGSQRHKEDFTTASKAAIQGGVVLVGDMPNNPDPPSTIEAYQRKRDLADERSLIDVVLYGLLIRGGEPFRNDIPWKCYFGPSVGDVDSWGDSTVEEVLAPFRGQMVMFHAEDPTILNRSTQQPTHEERRPPEAEVEAIRTILKTCKHLEIHPHIAHLSTADGLSLIEEARRGGQRVTTEVTPHHLCFDIENRHQIACGEWLQMNPPLRTAHDRAVLREGLLSGSVDCLATDHAPHTIEENSGGISGVPLLDTYGAYLCRLADEGIPWETLVDRASTTPAQLFSAFTDGRFGDLQPGSVASLSVMDLRQPWLIERQSVQSRAGWSPFEGHPFPGKVIETVIRGIRRNPTTSELLN